jgi:hypothetical protein
MLSPSAMSITAFAHISFLNLSHVVLRMMHTIAEFLDKT